MRVGKRCLVLTFQRFAKARRLFHICACQCIEHMQAVGNGDTLTWRNCVDNMMI